MLDVSPEKIHFSNMISHSVDHVINGTSSNTKIMSGSKRTDTSNWLSPHAQGNAARTWATEFCWGLN